MSEAILRQVNPYVLAAYLGQQRDFTRAIGITQELIDKSNNDRDSKSTARGYNLLGVILDSARRRTEAISSYQRAVELDPSLGAAYNNWGRLLLDEEKQHEAIAKFAKATEVDHRLATAYINLGVTIYKRDSAKNEKGDNEGQNKCDLAGTSDNFRKAIKLDPKSSTTYYNWGIIQLEKGCNDDAVVKFQTAHDLGFGVRNPNFYLNWGDALRAQNELGEAWPSIGRASNWTPRNLICTPIGGQYSRGKESSSGNVKCTTAGPTHYVFARTKMGAKRCWRRLSSTIGRPSNWVLNPFRYTKIGP